ncbi:MAG: type II toxin-antitoxin system VapC family toxin [Candidatus Melainabacteria bacterium]
MSGTLLIDTNVISFILKGDTRAARYSSQLVGNALAISFMTLAELDRWAIAHRWGERKKAQLDHYLTQFVVLPVDRLLCEQWAKVSDQAARDGKPIQCADAWIAATAILYDIPLVTHNPKDFKHITGLKILH